MRETVTDTIVYISSHYELRFEKQDMDEDLDGDCLVTVVDIMQVVARWGMTSADPDWDPRYDMDDDGDIDVADIMLVAVHWRETCEELAETVKYYTLGGRRVAMRKEPVGQQDTLYYLFSDHLGSTSVVYDTSNDTWTTLRYYPYGSTRSGEVPTDRLFTGQRFDDTIELYDYGARFYDPALGRFVQADTIVPNPGNPQDLNRYAYVRNNPLRYTDPSGHDVWDPGAGGSSWTEDELYLRLGEYYYNLYRSDPDLYLDTMVQDSRSLGLALARYYAENMPCEGFCDRNIIPADVQLEMMPQLIQEYAANPNDPDLLWKVYLVAYAVGMMEIAERAAEGGGWQAYEARHGATHPRMTVEYEGQSRTIVPDYADSNTLKEMKDFDFSNPAYQKPFMRECVIRDVVNQAGKYSATGKPVVFQFSQTPPLWLSEVLDSLSLDASVSYIVVP